jgi:hypothetical protein
MDTQGKSSWLVSGIGGHDLSDSQADSAGSIPVIRSKSKAQDTPEHARSEALVSAAKIVTCWVTEVGSGSGSAFRCTSRRFALYIPVVTAELMMRWTRPSPFFEVVHHLKDWLGNDASSGLTRGDGDALIASSPVLKLCADLANGSKHFMLTSTRTGDRSTGIIRNDVTVSMDVGVTHRFYVGSAGREHDALQIAEAAVAKWAGFLTSKGFL